MQKLKIEYWKLDDLQPYENNARKHGAVDIDAIVASITEFGFNDPIGVWHDTIVEGHGRLLAARQLGMDTVPVIRLDHLTDEQRRAYALAHNKTAELSGWDFDLLGEELTDLTDIDMSKFGFDVSSFDEEEAKDDDYEPVIPEEQKTHSGQIFVLGNHRLMCGDSSNADDVRNLMGGGESQDGFHRSALRSGDRRQK